MLQYNALNDSQKPLIVKLSFAIVVENELATYSR